MVGCVQWLHNLVQYKYPAGLLVHHFRVDRSSWLLHLHRERESLSAAVADLLTFELIQYYLRVDSLLLGDRDRCGAWATSDTKLPAREGNPGGSIGSETYICTNQIKKKRV